MVSEPQLLFVTDPWETLDHAADTTLRLVEEASLLGVACWWADVRRLCWTPAGARLACQRVVGVAADRLPGSFELAPAAWRGPTEFSHLFYRPDPPVDLAYLQPLQLLAADRERHRRQAGRCETEVINPLGVLQGLSEKLTDLVAPGLMPPSLAAAAWDELRSFGQAEGQTIAKPLHQCQSQGIELLSWQEAAAVERSRVVLAGLTDGFRRPALLQRFLPAVLEGETRVWFVDGELLACGRKRPAPGTYRIDMDKGATLQRHDLTPVEQSRVRALAAELRWRRVRLAAVDLIDGWVTDVNVTSPGLLPQLEALVERNLARTVVEAMLAPYGAWRGARSALTPVPVAPLPPSEPARAPTRSRPARAPDGSQRSEPPRRPCAAPAANDPPAVARSSR